MAKFNFKNLDEKTRAFMLSEVELDKERECFFISNRLNDLGKEVYESHLIKVIKEGDEEELEKLLDLKTYFNPTELSGGKTKAMASNASTLLSQSEFNRYYIRAICLRAIEAKQELVDIYRARESSWKRSESEFKIGTSILAKDLLEDLRNSIGDSPKLFPEINSGLSVKLKEE